MQTTTLQDLMRAATSLTQAGKLQEATQNIQQMLKQAAGGANLGNLGTGLAEVGTAASPARPASDTILDGYVFEVNDDPATVVPADATGEDRFVAGRHSAAGRTLDYKLYVPPNAAGKSLPLVVMLHGCTQDPDDFAAGTGMNALAREQGFLVLYPAQSQQANPSRCWNWFKHNHQRRGAGEPAVIASLTQKVIAEHGVDTRRVYVAGLSAGGAMAAILAETYPELFAAAGVHSGLPAGAARDMPGAFAVMKSGVSSAGTPAASAGSQPVPTIVFHGDRDETVHPLNGEQLMAAARRVGPARVEQGVSPKGRRYTKSVFGVAGSVPAAEHWLLHGAGHAWSGGLPAGTYTDANGPDASREMLRFFNEHPRR
jgi:poly(hydroxyalkanoate) depolymerase family esterase